MCARSNFMVLNRESRVFFLCFVDDEETVMTIVYCALQESYSTSAISVYFKKIHYLCFYQMRNAAN